VAVCRGGGGRGLAARGVAFELRHRAWANRIVRVGSGAAGLLAPMIALVEVGDDLCRFQIPVPPPGKAVG